MKIRKIDTVSGVSRLIDTDMARESISEMKNGKAAAPLCVVSEMVEAVGETGVDMIT